MSEQPTDWTGTIITLVLAGAMFMSNPSRQDHYTAIEKNIESKDVATAFAYALSQLLGVDNKLRYHNYLLFSTVSYEKQTVSVGFFGNVKVLEASDQETKPEATELPQPEPAAVPKPVASQQPSNLPSVEPGLLSTTSQLEDTSGEIFQVNFNEHGAVLDSTRMKIYLGNDCAASSPQYGNGKWNWKKEFGTVDLDKAIFHFNFQNNPFGDSRCGE